jgi:hypothetical protein
MFIGIPVARTTACVLRLQIRAMGMKDQAGFQREP